MRDLEQLVRLDKHSRCSAQSRDSLGAVSEQSRVSPGSSLGTTSVLVSVRVLGILDPGSSHRDPAARVRDLGTMAPDHGSGIRYPGYLQDPRVQDPGSLVRGPGSELMDRAFNLGSVCIQLRSHGILLLRLSRTFWLQGECSRPVQPPGRSQVHGRRSRSLVWDPRTRQYAMHPGRRDRDAALAGLHEDTRVWDGGGRVGDSPTASTFVAAMATYR